MRTAVTKNALQTPFRDGTVQDVAIEMVRAFRARGLGVDAGRRNEENFVRRWSDGDGAAGRRWRTRCWTSTSTSGGCIDKVYDDYVF